MGRNEKTPAPWFFVLLVVASLLGAGLACNVPDLETFLGDGNSPENVAETLVESAALAQEGASLSQGITDGDGLGTIQVGGQTLNVSVGELNEPERSISGLTIYGVEIGGAMVIQSDAGTGYTPATTVVGSAGRPLVVLLVDQQPELHLHESELVSFNTSALPHVGTMTLTEFLAGLVHEAGEDATQHYTFIFALNEGLLPDQVNVYATPLVNTYLVTPYILPEGEATGEEVAPTPVPNPRVVIARAMLPDLQGEAPRLLVSLTGELASAPVSTVPAFVPYTWEHIQRYVDWYYAASVEVQEETCLTGRPNEIVRMTPDTGEPWRGDTPIQIWTCREGSPPGPLAFEQTMVGYFAEEARESQVWTFEAERFDTVSVAINTGEGLTPQLMIRAADGTVIAEGGSGVTSLSEVILREQGSYEVVVIPYEGSGFYEVSLEYLGQMPVGGGPIAYGEAHTVTLLDADEADEWTFEGSAGDQITISMVAADTDDLDPTLVLLGPDGTELAWSDDYTDLNPFIETILYEDGEYTIQAGAFSGSGEYEIELELVGSAEIPEIGGGPIEYGDSVAALLTYDEYQQEWTFEGETGQLVTIAMNDVSNSVDPFLELFGPDGDSLISDDDGGEGYNSRISLYELPEDGTYTIVASSFGGEDTGIYELTLSLIEAPGGGTLTIGQTGEAEFTGGDTEHIWTFRATEGQILEITMIPLDPTVNPLLQLYDPDGALIRESLDFSDRTNEARLVVTAAATGEYRLIATSESHEDEGAYEITVVPFTLGTGDVQITLRWSSLADLDLSVIAPDGEEIFFGNPVGFNGGIFDIDANYPCSAATSTPVENIYWPDGTGLDGTYVVTVIFFDTCGSSDTVEFTLTITVDGVTETITETIRVGDTFEIEFER